MLWSILEQHGWRQLDDAPGFFENPPDLFLGASLNDGRGWEMIGDEEFPGNYRNLSESKVEDGFPFPKVGYVSSQKGR